MNSTHNFPLLLILTLFIFFSFVVVIGVNKKKLNKVACLRYSVDIIFNLENKGKYENFVYFSFSHAHAYRFMKNDEISLRFSVVMKSSSFFPILSFSFKRKASFVCQLVILSEPFQL
jgi:hypothetical protein